MSGKRLLLVLPCVLVFLSAKTQTFPIDSLLSYEEKKTYEIAEITIKGAVHTDEKAIRVVSGLKVGESIEIPGDKITDAVKSLWRQKLFTDIQISQQKVIGDQVFLLIELEERPRLSKYTFTGISKSRRTTLEEEVEPHLQKATVITDASKLNAVSVLKKYYRGKGYFDAAIDIEERPDDRFPNAVELVINVNRGERIKIDDINFIGNSTISDKTLRKKMKNTKERKRFLASSKLIYEDLEEDKIGVVAYYNTIGYRDARFMGDSIWRNDEGRIQIDLKIHEGDRYYFRNITWKGNSIYSDQQLSQRLGIEKGEPYNEEELTQRLNFSQDGRDVSALYQDNGYLFFNVDPTEIAIDNDSIDLEMRIFEGPQATIDKVIIRGNDKTHEHVIRREIRTKPGDKFSRSDLIRSQRQIIALGYFNQETMQVNPQPNAERGTVDIEYVVEERSSDQLELSAGYQPANRLVSSGGLIGTLGLTFNNFSLRNIFNTKAWSPLPQGDGQRLSIRAQTNAQIYSSYNFSFTEPWLGGNKPNALTLSAFSTRNGSFFNLDQELRIQQASIGLGRRLQWPDDNFVMNTSINFQNIRVSDWPGIFQTTDGSIISNGSFNNFFIQQTIARSTIADPIFPKEGSNISISLQATLPYSLLNNKNYNDISDADKFQWVEYHKWKFNAEWFKSLGANFVLRASAKMGFLGRYSRDYGDSPFERFELGSEPLANQFTITGRDQIVSRGYEIQDFPEVGAAGASIFEKFTVELRYPISLNPSSTIFLQTFLEGANAWNKFSNFNPLDLRRTVGGGVRVFLPMFGTLGFDYGIGFDKPNVRANPDSQFGDFGRFTLILGFEPE